MHATNIANILDLVVGNVSDKGLLSILPVVDILIQVCYSQLINCYQLLGFSVYSLSCKELQLLDEDGKKRNTKQYIVERL